MKKPSIPADQGRATLDAIKSNIDIITGRIGGKIAPLSSTATTEDIINKLNEIAAKLNYST